MNQELQKAIKDFEEAANEWLAKWNAIRALCQLLESIIPGFVCPWAESARPTIEEMTEWVSDLPNVYPELF